SSWLRATLKVLVSACQVAPPSSLTETRYLRGAAPLLMSVGLARWPVMITSPPKGLSTAVKPATAAGPLGKPVMPLMSLTLMPPTVSMNGVWRGWTEPGLMWINVSSRFPQTGMKLGLLHGGGTCHERIARILMILGPCSHGWVNFLRLAGRKTAYSSPPFGMLLMS